MTGRDDGQHLLLLLLLLEEAPAIELHLTSTHKAQCLCHSRDPAETGLDTVEEIVPLLATGKLLLGPHGVWDILCSLPSSLCCTACIPSTSSLTAINGILAPFLG